LQYSKLKYNEQPEHLQASRRSVATVTLWF